MDYSEPVIAIRNAKVTMDYSEPVIALRNSKATMDYSEPGIALRKPPYLSYCTILFISCLSSLHTLAHNLRP